MRLSEARIEFIAQQIAQSLTEKKYAGFYNRKMKFHGIIARIMIQDLAFEDKIDAEVEKVIKSIRRDIPEGSAEWVSIFQQKKEEVAKRYHYVY